MNVSFNAFVLIPNFLTHRISGPNKFEGYTPHMTEFWIPITIAAAFFQNLRSALQKHLKSQLTTAGATYVRFFYAWPFAIFYVWGLHHLGGLALPQHNNVFLLYYDNILSLEYRFYIVFFFYDVRKKFLDNILNNWIFFYYENILYLVCKFYIDRVFCDVHNIN